MWGPPQYFVHAQSAVCTAVRQELRDLLPEIEKLSEVKDPVQRQLAEIRFSRKVESGRYAVLFSEVFAGGAAASARCVACPLIA